MNMATDSVAPPRRRLGASCQGMVVLALLGFGIAAPVDAMSIREMRALEQTDKKQGEIYARYYLVGAMEGAAQANAHAVRSGAKALFCINERRLEPHMAKALFDTELRRNAGLYEADMPVQLVLLNALATAYPC